ncbi:T9SS C-terminal target domain-containing protein [Mucilaginibacter terrenus]|uniref:T9SS C-terminal target domain-containing protein n=1 Tax=Mucilaginibacter terrenus TaxID=2482727 RepID=A0A3E2NY70_9SPHI|nr:S8 family serine peptidase [Mucilaginibacter terrenus]RFZ85932.1 T9SS C-terminal target domain-containing protein [Mucilaginibacter terrenus]
MGKLYTACLSAFLILCCVAPAIAQKQTVDAAGKQELDRIAIQANQAYTTGRQKALSLAASKGWPLIAYTKGGNVKVLQGVNKLGFPVYLVTHNNTIAAATTGTNLVQPGGALGLNLSGSSAAVNNKLAIWDGGSVYTAHQEFAGKTITIKDGAAVLDHSTHVAGTMIAKGVYGPAKGMAFNTPVLNSWDFNNDVSEMGTAAKDLLLSNHSYGDVAGWDYNSGQNRWEWYGLPGDTVDYNFGFYDARVQSFDQVAYNAPYYLIVESAGNSRGSTGPAVGDTYYGFATRTNPALINKGPRPAGISNNDGFDAISTTGNAKNILTVGSIAPLPNGPVNRTDLVTSYFSSWGPTDDGRIKPDLVGDGENVVSTGVTSPTTYLTLSGTSMSAPNVTGSLYLLQEYYAQKNSNSFMRAATLKGLACHTAFDGGNIGPDYKYGWGLLNMRAAAQAITDNGTKSLISERTLTQGQTQTLSVTASGIGPLAVTISWTDPAGTPTADGIINSRTPKLVNDLDIRISDGNTTYNAWVLNPNNPGAAATTGDNIRDNVEQVYIANATPGKTYTVTVSHKGTLLSGSQAYSLIATGIGGAAYCASAPSSNADSRINNFTLSNVNNTPAPGCTSYSLLTTPPMLLEQGKTYPFSITLGTCGNNFAKAAKIFADWNGNGTFDADELIATTPVITATGEYTGTITVPLSVIPGNSGLLRVVLTETSDPTAITACGSYAKGETQDYLVQFVKPTTDAGVTVIVNAADGSSCAGSTSPVIRLKNYGSANISNIPVTVTVTSPNNTTVVFNEVYTGTITPLDEVEFVLAGKFNTLAGANYNIAAETHLNGDPITGNDKATGTIAISLPPALGALSAYLCSNTGNYLLNGTGDGQILWYKSPADALPVAFGPIATVPGTAGNGTFYAGLNDFSGTVGPATKNVFSAGGYNQFSPSVSVYTNVPVVLQTARMYFGNSGKLTITATNSSGQAVSTVVVNAAATRGTPGPGAQTNDPADQGIVVPLNLTLPTAGTYTISLAYDANVTVYRNNGGVTGYPFKIGGIFSILGNDALSPTNTNDSTYYKGFYYYFYDLKVKSLGCPSAARLPTVVNKPVITQNGFDLVSNFTDGNQWFLDGKAIEGATGKTFTPVQSGSYYVEVAFNGGCTSRSDEYRYALVAKNPDTSTDIGLTLFPVPAINNLNVVFVAKEAGTAKVEIITTSGQPVYTQSQSISAGNFSTSINTSRQLPGTYVLKVTLGNKVYSKKVIIVK